MENNETHYCVVDSDVIINLMKKRSEFVGVLEGLKEKAILCTTAYNAFEVLHGTFAHGNAEELHQTTQLLDSLVIFPFDCQSSQRAARISSGLEKTGKLLPEGDIVIAAITIENGARLLTGNKKHFGRIGGLKLV